MPVRALLLDEARADLHPPPSPPDLILRDRPDWRPVILFATLGGMHLANWTISILQGRSEAYFSLAFGTLFMLTATAFRLSRREIAVESTQRRIRLSYGFSRLRSTRFVSFDAVSSVRITLTPASPSLPPGSGHSAGLVELVCGGEVIECPPTPVARQEALCLAVLIGVPLTKAE